MVVKTKMAAKKQDCGQIMNCIKMHKYHNVALSTMIKSCLSCNLVFCASFVLFCFLFCFVLFGFFIFLFYFVCVCVGCVCGGVGGCVCVCVCLVFVNLVLIVPVAWVLGREEKGSVVLPLSTNHLPK